MSRCSLVISTLHVSPCPVMFSISVTFMQSSSHSPLLFNGEPLTPSPSVPHSHSLSMSVLHNYIVSDFSTTVMLLLLLLCTAWFHLHFELHSTSYTTTPLTLSLLYHSDSPATPSPPSLSVSGPQTH